MLLALVGVSYEETMERAMLLSPSFVDLFYVYNCLARLALLKRPGGASFFWTFIGMYLR